MPRKVALIGRPNTGKSTLFNRLVGKRMALVDDTPGVTRDRREGEASAGGEIFIVIDTPGLEESPDEALEGRMRAQAEIAISEAAVCLFLIDARVGVTPLDEAFAQLLRRSGKPVILVANKSESAAGDAGFLEAYKLGFDEPLAISAEHAQGIGELFQAIEPYIAQPEESACNDDQAWDDPLKPLRIAIVGRPNAGKSTLINRLIGEDRMLTGPEAGITRDAVSVEWRWPAKDRDWPVKLFDTAGMRKKAKVQSKLEKLSVADAIRAIQFAEVVVLLLDASNPFEKQDLQIADMTLREGRALIIAVNKWDEVEDRAKAASDIEEAARRLLPQAPGAPIVYVSALTGAGVGKIMPEVIKAYIDWNAKVKTPDLNDWLQDATRRHAPPAVSGKRIKIRYIAQTKTRPPTFVAQCNRSKDLPLSYKRYLVNGIRDAFGVKASPIRLIFRTPDNPYVKKKSEK